jgi:hypothetical protein
MKKRNLLVGLALLATTACRNNSTLPTNETTQTVTAESEAAQRLKQYATVRLNADLSHLSQNQKQLVAKLIEASQLMDEIFWKQAVGSSDSVLATAANSAEQAYMAINYGPWDRLAADEPFVAGVNVKPAGAMFYPADMTKAEFKAANLPDKKSQYTLIKRNANGSLYTVPYHQEYAAEVTQAAKLLEQAADLAEDKQFANYLRLRAEALRTDEYRASDMAWMDMKNNPIDVVIGPIETYEDQLFGYKAAHEAYVLIKDMEWSQRLARYAKLLPSLQENLPVPAAYKREKPGTEADLNAYDVVYYAGDSNAGSKTIAINLPNDEQVQLEKGSRRLQLKNAMQAKFDKIMKPIANKLIVEEQKKFVTYDAFFANTMFHEVAHGLGIKNTIKNKGTVREALKEHASALEEGKADVLGMHMILQLLENGELEGSKEEYLTTFMAGIFRSIRFGSSSAHGKANLIRFNYFKERGAFTKEATTGRYKVNFGRFTSAVNELSEDILVLQGNGDYKGVQKFINTYAVAGPELSADLAALNEANIPADIVFEQGTDVLDIR